MEGLISLKSYWIRMDLSTNLANHKYSFTFISKGDAIVKGCLFYLSTVAQMAERVIQDLKVPSLNPTWIQ